MGEIGFVYIEYSFLFIHISDISIGPYSGSFSFSEIMLLFRLNQLDE